MRQLQRIATALGLAAAVVCLLAQTPALTAQDAKGKVTLGEWKDFTSKGLGFKVMFPGTPKTTQEGGGKGGDESYRVSIRNLSQGGVLKEGGFEFIVFCQIFASHADKEKAKQHVADIGRLLSERKYYESKKEIQLGDVPGIEVKAGYSLKDGTLMDNWSRNYRTDRLLYTLRVGAEKGKLDPKNVEKFFESFKLLSPDKNLPGLDETPAKGVLLNDTFTARNGTLLYSHWMNTGFAWERLGGGEWRIYDKRVKLISNGAQDAIVADAGSTDGIMTCDMVTPDAPLKGMDAGLVVRAIDPDNYYLLALYPDGIQVFKKSSGNYAPVAKAAYNFKPKTTYQMKLTVKGDALAAAVNGAEQVTAKMDAFL
jgi:hypothetical protein